MTGFVRKAMLLGATGLLVASAAWANVPDCTHSTYAGWLKVTGYTSTNVPDPTGVYCVTIRDFANNPIGGVTVTLDLSACCDINICTDAVPGQTLVSCTPAKISVNTDAAGTACFSVTGGAKDAGTYTQPNAPNGATSACVRLTAGTTDCGLVASALSLDQNGVVTPGTGPGVSTLDLSVLKALVTANNLTSGGKYRARANYSGPSANDVAINALDLSGLQGEIKRVNLTPTNSSKNGCPSGTYCTTKTPGPNCP